MEEDTRCSSHFSKQPIMQDLGNGDCDCDTNSCEGKGSELKPTSGSAALQVQADLQDLGEESRRQALWRQ